MGRENHHNKFIQRREADPTKIGEFTLPATPLSHTKMVMRSAIER
jgi:hypothetical protein